MQTILADGAKENGPPEQAQIDDCIEPWVFGGEAKLSSAGLKWQDFEGDARTYKPTKILTNIVELSCLAKRCRGGHHHVRLRGHSAGATARQVAPEANMVVGALWNAGGGSFC